MTGKVGAVKASAFSLDWRGGKNFRVSIVHRYEIYIISFDERFWNFHYILSVKEFYRRTYIWEGIKT